VREQHTKEIWKPIAIAELCTAYECSNFGRVRSVVRKSKVIKPADGGKGYLHVTLKPDNRKAQKSYKVARLIGLTFVSNPDPKTRIEIHHIDHCKANNAASNLQWVTHSENIREAQKAGVMASVPDSLIYQIYELRFVQGVAWEEIGKRLNRPYVSLYSNYMGNRKRLNLPHFSFSTHTPAFTQKNLELTKEIHAARSKGLSWDCIAANLGKHRNTVKIFYYRNRSKLAPELSLAA
jgi:cyanate lyase